MESVCSTKPGKSNGTGTYQDGEVVYGISPDFAEVCSAKVIKDTEKRVMLDTHIHYMDLNGNIRFAKIIAKRFIPEKGLPRSNMEAVQQVYRMLISDVLEARALYAEALRAIDHKKDRMDLLVKSLGLNRVQAMYPNFRG